MPGFDPCLLRIDGHEIQIRDGEDRREPGL